MLPIGRGSAVPIAKQRRVAEGSQFALQYISADLTFVVSRHWTLPEMKIDQSYFCMTDLLVVLKLMGFRMHYPLCLSSFIIITGLLQWISMLVVVNWSISVGLAKLHLTPNFLMEFARIFIILLHALCSSLEFPTKREKNELKLFDSHVLETK